jgi:hypothetical protein
VTHRKKSTIESIWNLLNWTFGEYRLNFFSQLQHWLQPTVSRPVYLGVNPHLRPNTRFVLLSDSCGFADVGALSDERISLSFTTAASPRQRSRSLVRVQHESWPYFTVSDSRLPLPGRPGPRIYIPQEQGGPVTIPGTGSPFRRLLRLVGLRYMYPNPPPHGLLCLKFKVTVILGLAVYSQSVRLGAKPLQNQDQRFLFPKWTLAVIVIM